MVGRVAMNLAWMATRKYASTRLIATASQDLVEMTSLEKSSDHSMLTASHWQAAINIKSTLASHVQYKRTPERISAYNVFIRFSGCQSGGIAKEIQPPASS
jgi:hypothetical protein